MWVDVMGIWIGRGKRKPRKVFWDLSTWETERNSVCITLKTDHIDTESKSGKRYVCFI